MWVCELVGVCRRVCVCVYVTPAGMSGPGHFLDLFHSLAALQLAGLGLILLYWWLEFPVLVEVY